MNSIARTLCAVCALLLSCSVPAGAEVTHLEISSKAPYGTFRPGEYLLWKGRVHGEIAATEAIPDLDKAKRNSLGKVEYAADILLLMPADLSKGNGALLVDVPNRGNVYGIALYNGPRGEPFNSGNIQQGTGFLEDQGFSLAEVQWEMGKGTDLPTFVGADGRIHYVEGVGFAIVRDAADFFAHRASDSTGTANPLRGLISHTLASGKSQSGRFLKTFLLNGFNMANGRRVFDGMHIFVSGAGLLPIMQSGSGPNSSADAAPSFEDPEFPGVHEGPFTIGEILATVEKRRELAPKIIMLSSTTDFISLRASLGRTGGSGIKEQAIPANVRMYDIAGASHVVRPKVDCKLPLAHLDWSPVSRATLLHLDRWVISNIQPPENQLMPLEPATEDADVLQAPAKLVKAVIERPKRDVDGNVLGGVRLPDLAVPLGVHAAQQEPKSFGCSLAGAFLPFSESKIAQLYKNRDDYVNKIRFTARELELKGFLLPEDAAVIIASAASLSWPTSAKK